MSDSTEAITPVAAVKAKPAAEAPPATPHIQSLQPVTDTATLSETAQVTLLQEKGESVSEIAAALGLSIAEVDNDLAIAAQIESPLNTSKPG